MTEYATNIKELSPYINKTKQLFTNEQKSTYFENVFQLAQILFLKQSLSLIQMERNNISLIFTFQPPLTPNRYPISYPSYQLMKHNNPIDFFSSPNSRFIGFSDIRYPHADVSTHPEVGFDSVEDDRKMCRKLSFSASNAIEPIMPFGVDFFQEKLEECDEPEQYSQNNRQQEIQQNSLMMDTHFRAIYPLMKSPNPQPKQPQFLATPHTMRLEYQDMPEAQNQYQVKIEEFQNEIYTTPRRKSQLFSARKSCDSTAQKSMSRNNEKGLRRLSSLAYSIVSQSTTTTYKQVAEKLLNHLNFNSAEMDEEDGTDKSSMQNVKRRVYDSLNVLLALGVIKRVGSKIAKQKQRKPFTTDASPDLQRYNEMLAEYNQRVKALQTRKRTQKQLKQKLQIFRKTVQRNKKTKQINKTKMIRLPFLAFVSREEGQVEWLKKQLTETNEKKKTGKRSQQTRDLEKGRQTQDQVVKLVFKGYPESYGDLDFFRLLQQEQSTSGYGSKEVLVKLEEPFSGHELQEYEYDVSYMRAKKEEEMNLIDEVLGNN